VKLFQVIKAVSDDGPQHSRGAWDLVRAPRSGRMNGWGGGPHRYDERWVWRHGRLGLLRLKGPPAYHNKML
jgi:hypothetical protein